MRVITQLPNNDLEQSQAVARLAERAGFDGVVALENAHGPYLPLAAAALATQRIQLGTAVAMAFPRSPTITAHTAWDLQKASRGRFYLGLGAQVKAHNERRYGLAWTPPAPRMRDYIGAVRAIWRCWEKREPLDYRSPTYTLTLMTPNFSPQPMGLPRIPVSMAAVGPAMLRVAGEVGDGVRMHPFSTRRYLEEVSLVELGQGLTRAGRSRKNVEVVAGGFIATGADDDAVARMREYVRFRVAFYCSTRAYWGVLRLHGMEELGEKLNPFPRQNRWDEMAAQIPDDAIGLFAVVGRYDKIAGQIADRYAGLADSVSLPISPTDDPDQLGEMARAIQRIPTKFEGYADTWS
jgi:probable F420-dependent oxidoreductase